MLTRLNYFSSLLRAFEIAEVETPTRLATSASPLTAWWSVYEVKYGKGLCHASARLGLLCRPFLWFGLSLEGYGYGVDINLIFVSSVDFRFPGKNSPI